MKTMRIKNIGPALVAVAAFAQAGAAPKHVGFDSQGRPLSEASAQVGCGASEGARGEGPGFRAMWGARGQEWVLACYKGRLASVSMQKPSLPQGEGWFLDSVEPSRVVFSRMRAGKIHERETVRIQSLGAGGQATATSSTMAWR